jgi:hypothetical protein
MGQCHFLLLDCSTRLNVVEKTSSSRAAAAAGPVRAHHAGAAWFRTAKLTQTA